MTTYKYSTPWCELESCVARAVDKDTWKKFCSATNTVFPAIELPETEVNDEVFLKGGTVAQMSSSESALYYRSFKHERGKFTGRNAKITAAFAKKVIECETVVTDLPAVHAAYLELSAWATERASSYASALARWSATVAATTLYGHTQNDRMSSKATAAKSNLIAKHFHVLLTHPLQVLEAVRKLKSARHARKLKKLNVRWATAETEAEKRAAQSAVRSASRSMLPATFPRVEFWAGRVVWKLADRVLVLPTGDLQRLEQYAASVLNMTAILVFKAGIAVEDPTAQVRFCETEFKRMSTAVATLPSAAAVHVCRAYKQAYGTALANHAGRADAYADAKAELEGMPYAADCGAMDHLARLEVLTVSEIVNLGKVHKALPASTSAGIDTLHARYLKSKTANPKRPIAKDRPPFDDELVAKCHRDEIAIALRKMDEDKALRLKDPALPPSWYRAWSERKVVPSVAGWSRMLDLTGEAVVLDRSDYSAGTFKDSALAPDELPEFADQKYAPEETNMAMRRFLSVSYPSQAKARKALLRTSARITKSDQKSENYKDPLRLFYEAVLIDRMGVSWTESNIYRVASHHPCYMLGKAPAEQQAKARAMAEPAEGGYAKRFFSFDVSNWSAGMSARVQRMAGSDWAEVFDCPEMGCAYNVMKGSTVYVQKHGMLAGFVPPEANFEGYNGKALTMLHLALMSATVHRTRQVTNQNDMSAELMTYIDDGAAALTLPRKLADSVFDEFMKCAEEVYGYEQFVLHPLKCMPSDRMFTFLNEVYYAGAHEVSATKAALRIASEPKQETDSLVDRIMTLSSGAQGAVAAGLPAVTASVFCYFLTALELRSWWPDEKGMLDISPVSIALMIASPAAYYGLAVPSPKGFDKTGRGASLSEGIAAMQSFAMSYPQLRRVVVARLRKPLPARTPESILRNPTGCAGHSVLRTNRVTDALAEVAPQLAVNPIAKSVMSVLRTFDARSYAKALFGDSETLSATAITMAYKATPLANADSWLAKFESSKTIRNVIGAHRTMQIMRSHREDAKTAIAVACQVMI